MLTTMRQHNILVIILYIYTMYFKTLFPSPEMRCGNGYNFSSLQIHPEKGRWQLRVQMQLIRVENRALPARRHQAEAPLALVQLRLSPAGCGPRAKSVVPTQGGGGLHRSRRWASTGREFLQHPGALHQDRGRVRGLSIGGKGQVLGLSLSALSDPLPHTPRQKLARDG